MIRNTHIKTVVGCFKDSKEQQLITLNAYSKSFPLKKSFVISRGSKTSAEVVVVEFLRNGKIIGHGEAVPYNRYGEDVDSTLKEIQNHSENILSHMNRIELLRQMPAGSARNCIDCALWDYEAKIHSKSVWELTNIDNSKIFSTAYTISSKNPSEIFEQALTYCKWPILKLKLTGENDIECLNAASKAAPYTKFIADVNEAWNIEELDKIMPILLQSKVVLIEQPLPASLDDELAFFKSPIPICADESFHLEQDLHEVKKKYQMINIKLDKTGGLTHALQIIKKIDIPYMVGCMVSSSLAIIPALVLGNKAQIIDLDGPLLLKKDRQGGILYKHAEIDISQCRLWGNFNCNI